MDDWSTLIYVILGIVVFIFSAKKGKKQTTQAPAGQIQKKSALENFLSQQLPPEWSEEAQKQDLIETKEIIDEMGIAAENEGSVEKSELEPILKYEKDKKETKTSAKKKKKVKFDAKKAIIYSSILNRKYK